MLRRHKHLILNRFKADGRLSSGTVEGFNLKAKLAMRKAYGYKSLECLQTAGFSFRKPALFDYIIGSFLVDIRRSL